MAESYENEICVKGLPAFMSDKNVCYDLDLGHRILNCLERKTFTLTNTSKYRDFKFEISCTNYLVVLPRVGHLKAQTSKDIEAAFRSKEPIQIKQVNLLYDFRYSFLYNIYCRQNLK